MKKNIFFAAIFFLLLASCTNNKKRIPNADEISISIDLDTNEPVELLPFVSKVQYIKLETNKKDDNTLVAEIKKIILDSINNIYVHDNLNRILVFNKDGGFKYTISKVGNGPGEYVKIDNFALNEVHRRIEILDLPKRKIHCYNIQDGTFLNSFDLHQFSYSVFPIADDCYLSSLPTDLDISGIFGVFLLDSLYQKKENILEYSGKYPLFAQDIGIFSKIGKNKYGIYSQVENTIIHWDNGNMEKKYTFDWKKRKSIESLRGRKYRDLSTTEKEDIAPTTFYQETNAAIILLVSDREMVKIILYDKATGVGQASATPIFPSHIFNIPVRTDTEGVLISVFSSDLVTDFNEYNPDNKNGLDADLYELMVHTEVEDNPIIQIIQLKSE
jgi:hypothetical protein